MPIVNIDEIGRVLERLNSEYAKGNVKELIVSYVVTDTKATNGESHISDWNNGKFIEKLGMLESTKDCLLRKAGN